MPRFPQQRPPLDETVLVDLDVQWRGVNERDEPGTLPGAQEAAYATAAVNVSFRAGRAETRNGFVRPVPWNMQLVPAVLNEGGHRVVPGVDLQGVHLGCGLWSGPDGEEWILLPRWDQLAGVDHFAVWRVRANTCPRPVSVDYTPGVIEWPTADAATTAFLASVCTFAQLGQEVVMFRTGEQEPLHWSGIEGENFQASSVAEVPGGLADYLRPLPAEAGFGIAMSGRIVFPVGQGEIGWTDLLEPRRWDSSLSRNTIGGTGPITGLAEWRRGTLVIFKATGVWALSNFTGALDQTVLERVSDQAGCIAHRTITNVGGDLVWLARGGVYRLSEVLEGSSQLQKDPVSWPIPLSMGRINWKAAAGQACAALADGVWLLCVPVDGSDVNNALFAFDTRTGEWQGEWKLETWDIEAFKGIVRSPLFGRETLALVARRMVLAQGTGWHDGYGRGDIRTRLETRGYALSDAGLKRLRSLIVDTEELGTHRLTLSAQVDGKRAVQPLVSERTRNRAKSLVFGRADRDLANPNDDADEPNREDYALLSDDAAILGSGVPLEVLQAHRLRGHCTGAARWVKALIESQAGRLRINAVKAEGFARSE